jgi:hypothetical protein
MVQILKSHFYTYSPTDATPSENQRIRVADVSNVRRDVNGLSPQDIDQFLAREEIRGVGSRALNLVAAASFSQPSNSDVRGNSRLRIGGSVTSRPVIEGIHCSITVLSYTVIIPVTLPSLLLFASECGSR